MLNLDNQKIRVVIPIQLIKAQNKSKVTIKQGTYTVNTVDNPMGKSHPWVVLADDLDIGICHLSFEALVDDGLVELQK